MRTLSKFLFTTSLLILLSTNLIAQKVGSTFSNSSFEYKITSISPRKVAIVNYKQNVNKLLIPPTVEYKGISYTITEIGNGAFANKEHIRVVSLPNTITKIGKKAFSNCIGIESINLPSSLKIIDDYAFLNCRSIRYLEFPNSLTSIGDFAFVQCESLGGYYKFPNSIKHIGDGAFAGAFYSGYNATVELPDTTTFTKINRLSFAVCRNLKSVEFGEHITEIGDSAFYLSALYSQSSIPNSVKDIGIAAFKDSGLKVIDLPSSLTKIKRNTFLGCTNLDEIVIPKSVKLIEPEALYHITKIYIFADKDIEKIMEDWSNSFFDTPYPEERHLYVPKGMVEAYKNSPWAFYFTNNISEIPEVMYK